MTNVMAYLAARSLRGAHPIPADDGAPMPVVRPRLPSRYEANANQPQIAIEEIEQENASGKSEPAARLPTRVAAADLSVRTPPTSIRPAVTPRPPSVAQEGTERATIAPTKNRPLPTLAQPAGPPAGLNPAGDAAAPRAQTVSTPPPSGSHATRSTTPPSVSHTTTPTADDPAPPYTPPPPAPPHPVVEQPTQYSMSPALVRLMSEPKPTVARPPAVGVAPRVSLPPAAPLDSARPRDQTDSSRAVPPRVQVTIGRLEIRAITAQPPTPSRRALPRAPALSLDDYLAARSKT